MNLRRCLLSPAENVDRFWILPKCVGTGKNNLIKMFTVTHIRFWNFTHTVQNSQKNKWFKASWYFAFQQSVSGSHLVEWSHLPTSKNRISIWLNYISSTSSLLKWKRKFFWSLRLPFSVTSSLFRHFSLVFYCLIDRNTLSLSHSWQTDAISDWRLHSKFNHSRWMHLFTSLSTLFQHISIFCVKNQAIILSK